ncbi:hypothetical protein LEP1GSC203_1773 [Leptospira terpstrae serovar Hualin str. LT 11-33 = ATCC 700639]|uniref:Uncharacterized protein n=1 Tax=Leptospira terpstrae serovar Hualin str. LT 11-33 = ATCC 700639 TaxID=1257025 RepID=N1VW98_9LEPT|nr:hypothetical protein LEP1GSC203_1773 [Leptospira terpstrae serovar Hualin str. LT 11-33 = ATCC 700639]
MGQFIILPILADIERDENLFFNLLILIFDRSRTKFCTNLNRIFGSND